jgi:ribosomal protein S18 acetylase RimI-like enzyme
MSGIPRSELVLLHLRKMAQKHVRPMTPEDIHVVVDIHMAAFPGYFTTSLGPKFLALFYAEAQRSRSSINYVFERDGRVLGFCVGTFSPGRFYRGLFIRQWFPLAAYSLRVAVKQPLILGRIVRSLFERVGRRSEKDIAFLGTTAVFPEEQARGYGLAIVSAFIDHIKKLGGKQVRGEVLKEDQNLIRAYQKMGFEVLRETHVPPATTLVELCYRIGNEEGRG